MTGRGPLARLTIRISHETSGKRLLHHHLELSSDQAKACLAGIEALVAAVPGSAQISRRDQANGSLIVANELNRPAQPTFEQLFRRPPGRTAQAPDSSP